MAAGDDDADGTGPDPAEARPAGRGSPGRRPPGRAPLPGWWWALSVAQRRAVAAALVVVPVALVVLVAGAGGPGRSEAERFVDALPAERVDTWDELAGCESGGDWSLDTGNGFFGGLQFRADVWRNVGGEGLPSEHPREEQIMRAEMLHDLQGWGAWPSCSARLGLTGGTG